MRKIQMLAWYFLGLFFIGISGSEGTFAQDFFKIEQKAQNLWKKGKYYESSLQYEILLQNNPQKLDYYVALTRLYRTLYVPKKMKLVLEQGLLLDPENTTLLTEKAGYLLLQKEVDSAIQLLLRLVEKNQEYSLMMDLADAYIDKKEEPTARKWIQQATSVLADQPRTCQIWAKFHFQFKNVDMAINYCWFLLDNYDPQIYPLLKLGNGWVYSHAEPEAALEPKISSPEWIKAIELYQQGSYELALPLFKSSAEETFAQHFFRGCTYLHLQNHKQAEQELKIALEIEPKNARNLNALGTVKLIRARKKQALAYHPLFPEWKFPDVAVLDIEQLIPPWSRLSPEEKKLLSYSIYPFRQYLPHLIAEKVHHHIIDFSQKISNIPELTYLESDRVRTFDGRLYQDVRGVGGKNAVTSLEDIWYAMEAGFNTFAHEFAHQLMEFGFSSKEQEEIKRLYLQAKEKNLFVDDYADSNPEEYFAQGYEAYISFFKRPWCGRTADNTHHFLKKIDPDLFLFLEQKRDPDFFKHPQIQHYHSLCEQLQKEFAEE
ncbi:MAG: hypothetical protein AABZ60_17995 [Planctomycetota bacterium]